MGVVTDVIFLSGLAPLSGLRRGGDLRGLYSAFSQGSWWFEDIPLAVWGLCFGKVGEVISCMGEVISCLVGPVRGYHWTGPQCLSTAPVSASSTYAAIVYVLGVFFLSYPVSCVNLSMLLIILSLSFPAQRT